jgi:hypothetical protein
MDSPGKYLRKEREFRNRSLPDAAKFTRVREEYLRAIEDDKYELLPSSVYVKGFLTLYAKYLGVDPDDVVSCYHHFVNPPNIPEQVRPRLKCPLPKRKISLGVFFPFLSFIALVVIVLSYGPFTDSGEPRPASSPPDSLQKPLAPALIPREMEEMPLLREAKQIIKPKEGRAEATAAGLESPAFIVLEASIGSGIEKAGGLLSLTEKCSEFTCDNRKVYFFTRVMTPREGKIVHVWLWNGKEFYRKEIDIKPPAWSVYSYIVLRSPHHGNWNAEVRDADKVLARLSFRANESIIPLSPSETQ